MYVRIDEHSTSPLTTGRGNKTGNCLTRHNDNSRRSTTVALITGQHGKAFSLGTSRLQQSLFLRDMKQSNAHWFFFGGKTYKSPAV